MRQKCSYCVVLYWTLQHSRCLNRCAESAEYHRAASGHRAASDVEAAAADGVDVHRPTVGQRHATGHGRAGGPGQRPGERRPRRSLLRRRRHYDIRLLHPHDDRVVHAQEPRRPQAQPLPQGRCDGSSSSRLFCSRAD